MALNKGAALAGCLQNTGEGALSPYHRQGGDLVFQIGTSYFGCRDEDGAFDLRAARRALRQRAGADDRDQAVAGRQARPRRHAARGQGDRGDRRDPRHPGRRGLCLAEPARGLPRRRLDARLRRAGRRRDRAAGRDQERRGQHGVLGRPDRGDERPSGWSTSSTSTAARAAPAPRRWSSPTRSPSRSGSASPRSTSGSPRPGSPTTSRSSAPASSASRTTRWSPSRWAATWSTSAARRCWPSAASRRRSATPTSARPASRPSSRG